MASTVLARALAIARAHLPLVAAASALKTLLAFGYRSTDFEVHRNWLAVTHAFYPSRWYVDAGPSEWTLDYPPLFAVFEWALGALAGPLGVPEALRLSKDPVATPGVVLFQRASVHVADALLFVGACAYAAAATSEAGGAGSGGSLPTRWRALLALLLLNPGLVLLDHIHFQYNGMLLGLLLLTLALVRTGRHDCLAAASFTALVLSKHLFLVLGPAFAVYLYRRACVADGGAGAYVPSARRLAGLAGAVFSVAAVPLALVLLPFEDGGGVAAALAASPGRLSALLGRLFPFGRGLTHSYWAPNVWALYSGADRVLFSACRVVAARVPSSLSCGSGGGRGGGGGGGASPTGLATNTLLLLPQPTPAVSALLVLLSASPVLISLWRCPRPSSFALSCSLCWFAAFAFGWHVHEKAALYGLVPLWVAAGEVGAGNAGEDGAGVIEKAGAPRRPSAEDTAPPPPPTTAVGPIRRRARAGSEAKAPSERHATLQNVPVQAKQAAESTGLLRAADRALDRIVLVRGGIGLRRLWLLSLPAHTCLLPLIFTPLETPAALMLVFGFAWWSWGVLREAARAEGLEWAPLGRGETALVGALAGAALFTSCGLHVLLVPGLPFLHLMVMSIVCAVGLAAAAIV